jgi:hypothetical protein
MFPIQGEAKRLSIESERAFRFLDEKHASSEEIIHCSNPAAVLALA